MDRTATVFLRSLNRLRLPWTRRPALLLLLMLFTIGTTAAFESNGFTFEILDDTSVIITGSTAETIEHLDIPSAVTYSGITYNVTQIGESAFARKGIKTVNIPEGVIVIKGGAFTSNEITEVHLPHSLRTLEDSFYGNDLKKANLPGNVTDPGYYRELFGGAGGLDDTIDEFVIEAGDTPCDISFPIKFKKLTVQRHWTRSCPGVTDELIFNTDTVDVRCMNYANSYICFDIFPEKMSFIGDNITIIQSGIAWKSPHSSFLDEAIQAVAEFKALKRLETLPYQTKSVNINCTKLTGGVRIFSNFKGITSFTANAENIEFGRGTFAYCDNLAYVDLTPFNGVQDGMFHNCTALTELTIKPGNRFVNGMAFLGCTALKKIEIEQGSSPLIIGANAIKKIPIEELILGRDIVAGDMPFYNIKSLQRLTLRDNISELPDYAFAGCTGLKEIYCESSIPPVIHPNTFKGVSRTECKVFIRDNENGYREDENWKEFFSGINHVEDDTNTLSVTSEGGFLNIDGCNGEHVSVYDMQGNEVIAPMEANDTVRLSLPSGYYIVVCGNKHFKHLHK